MSATKKYGELFGRGMLYHGDGDCMLRDFEQCTIRFASNEVDLPKGNLTLDELKVYFRAGAELTIGFHSIGPEVLALMLGGTSTANLGLHCVEDEVGTVPAAPAYTVTAANSTIATVGTTSVISVYEVDTSGNRVYFDQVTAGLGANEFTIAAQVLTFDATEAESTVYMSYMYTNATGTQVAWNPDDLPSKFTFYGIVNWLGDAGDPTDQFGIKCLNVIPKPDFEIGASRAGHNPVNLTCSINNDAVGDVIFYFDA
jgi:hypothetical protein